MATTAIKRENFSTRSKKLGINGVVGSNTKIPTYLIGKKIIITGNSNSHNYGPIGTVVEVTGSPYVNGGSGNNFTAVSNLVSGGNQIMFANFSVIEDYTVDMLEEQLEKLKQAKKDIDVEIVEVKAKVSFMKDNKLDTFNENEFKVFHTLQLLSKKDLSEMDKAKAIAKLISA